MSRFDSLLTYHSGEVLNVLVCVPVFLVCLLYRFGLEAEKARPATDGIDAAGLSALKWAYSCWTGAWACWVFLYGFMLSIAWRGVSDDISFLTILLSDFNSAVLCLVALTIFFGVFEQGRSIRFIIVLVVLVLVDGLLWLAGSQASNDKNQLAFLGPWSTGLAMFAPVAVGYAFKLRYGGTTTFLLACVYAFLQPFAYGSAFTESISGYATLHSKAKITISDEFDAHVTEIANTGGGFSYELKTSDSSFRNRLTGEQIRELIEQFPSKNIGVLAGHRAYLQLRFDDLLYVFLALLKLFWGAALTWNMISAPESMKSVVNGCAQSTRKLSAPYGRFVLSFQVVAAAVVAWAIFKIHGIEIFSIAAVFGIANGIYLFVTGRLSLGFEYLRKGT